MSCDYYEALGRRVRVRSTSTEFARQTGRLLRSFRTTTEPAAPGCATPGKVEDLDLSFYIAPPPKSRGVRPFHFAFRGYDQIARTSDYWQLFRHLEWQLDFFLAEHIRDYYLLHAGAVSKGGAGIILPGESGSGKSSLTLALTRRGYRYLSDELAAISPESGELQPFPKPLGLKDISVFPDLARRDGLWLGPEPGERMGDGPVWYLHPEDLAPGSTGSPVPVRYIIFPSYTPGAAPHLSRLSSGQAMQRLIETSVNHTRFGGAGLHILADLIEGAESYSLVVNDLEETTALIDDLVAGREK